MKIIDMSCPNCSAKMTVDIKNKKATCEHCGTEVLIDDEVKHVQYDNPEEAGYKFEKGRQRAQRENMTTTYSNSNTPKKNNMFWLWVLGWICIFPIPLTILMLRKKDMKPAVKYGILAVAWLVYIMIGIAGKNSNSDVTENSTAVASTQASIEKESEDESVVYAGDDIVNKFITEYNEQSNYTFTDISKGNIRTKYFAHTNDCYAEILHIANGVSSELGIDVTISGGQTDEETAKLIEVFPYVVKTIVPSVTDEELTNMVDKFKALTEGKSEHIQLNDDIEITMHQTFMAGYQRDSYFSVTSKVYGK